MSLLANTIARLELALRAMDARITTLEAASAPENGVASDLEQRVMRLDCDKCKVEQDLETVRNSISTGMKKERSIIEALLSQKVSTLVEDALTADRIVAAAGGAMERVTSKVDQVSARTASAAELASKLDERLQIVENKVNHTTVDAVLGGLEASPALDGDVGIDMIPNDPSPPPKGRGGSGRRGGGK